MNARRVLPLLVLVACLLPPAAAQPHAPDPDGYSFRAVLGDDPRTTATESDGTLVVRQTFPIVNDGTEPLTAFDLFLPLGAELGAVGIDNGTGGGTTEDTGEATTDGMWLTYRFPANESVPPGATEPWFAVSYTIPAASLGDVDMAQRGIPDGLDSYSFLVIVPEDVAVDSDPPMEELGFSVYEGKAAYLLEKRPSGGAFQMRLQERDAPSPSAGLDTNWLLIGIALVGGVVIGWGLASMRRKPAAPREGERLAAKNVAELEARKRALMAALKELEIAHRSGEVPAEAYNPVKADLKNDAVKVMTELEKRQAQPSAT